MFKNLTLERPLAVLDLETTGTDPQKDRIIEVSILKIFPDGRTDHRTRRVNPGVPIPPPAAAIHGISDADVAGEPSFRQLAQGLLDFLDGCDLCGFNIKGFDLRLLYEEVRRAGLTLSLDGRAIVDAMEIFQARERRDLPSAVKFYCGRDHDGAHAASADVLATAEVLDAMLDRYADLPRNVAGLFQYFRRPNAVDANNQFVQVDGQVRFAFGKYRGQALDDVAQTKPDYLEWILTQNFYEDAKVLVKNALAKARGARPEETWRVVGQPELDPVSGPSAPG